MLLSQPWLDDSKSCCWKQNPLNCETAAEYTGLRAQREQSCMYVSYETSHICSFTLYIDVYPWFRAMTNTHTHTCTVDLMWAFGYGQMECALSMHGWTAYRDVPDSRQPIAVQRPAPKNTIWRSVTHMGHALHPASLPKLLQGRETRPKNAKRDTATSSALEDAHICKVHIYMSIQVSNVSYKHVLTWLWICVFITDGSRWSTSPSRFSTKGPGITWDIWGNFIEKNIEKKIMKMYKILKSNGSFL